MRPHRAFTLVELLVALGIMLLLIGIALPSFRAVRRSAETTGDLNNLRNLGVAHATYMADHDSRIVDAGLPHGGIGDPENSWFATMDGYYDDPFVLKSPLDDSPHWALDLDGKGVPVPGTKDAYRRTSYGCNNYLTQYSQNQLAYGWRHERMDQVKSPAATVHFLIMAFEGEFAGADHVHVEKFKFNPPVESVANGLQTDAVRGPEASWGSVSNYGFLDGRVETLSFADVYLTPNNTGSPTVPPMNRFDPEVSWQWATRNLHAATD